MRSATLIALLLLACVLLLTACEKPDFTGVRFKPPELDPAAHKTALRAYLFAKKPQEMVWGNEFLYHSRSLAEQEFSPLPAVEVLFDEAVPLKTDESGLIALDSQGEGFHTLRFRRGETEVATYLRLKKAHVTLLILELSGSRLNVSSCAVPHTFLTVPHFKRLLSFHHGIAKVVRLYEEAQNGRSINKWERLLADDYLDDYGGKKDFIRSLRAKGAGAVKVLDGRSELAEKAGSVIVRMARDERPDFVRLDLAVTERGAWRVTSIKY